MCTHIYIYIPIYKKTCSDKKGGSIDQKVLERALYIPYSFPCMIAFRHVSMPCLAFPQHPQHVPIMRLAQQAVSPSAQHMYSRSMANKE